MPTIHHRSTGVEELLDEVEIVLMRDINAALNEVYERSVPRDQARADRRNVDYVPLTFDTIPPEHFHTGNFPSLVLEEVPKEAYPYIVITIEDYVPAPDDASNDHLNVFRESLVVHCLTKASPEEGAEVCFRRAIRMGEAVYLTLASDPKTSSALAGFSNPQRGQHSVPWTHQHKGRGKDWWFQAVGTSYAIKNYTSMYT